MLATTTPQMIIWDVSFDFMTSQWNSIVTSSYHFFFVAFSSSVTKPSSVLSFNNSWIAREIVLLQWTSISSHLSIPYLIVSMFPWLWLLTLFHSKLFEARAGKKNAYLILSYRSLVFSQAAVTISQCSLTVEGLLISPQSLAPKLRFISAFFC